MRNYIFSLMAILYSSVANGTTYLPISIKKQITESSAIVKGEVVTVSSEEDEDGRILTKVFLRADKWIGANPQHGHIEVYYPGGQIGDRVQKVHGAPTFWPGEKVVLMLKESKDKHWLLNLSLGKFMIKKYGVADIIINSVFPNHPEVGQIPLKSFYELASTIKQRDFKERFKDKYEIASEKQAKVLQQENSRSIASDERTKTEAESVSTMWIIILLGVLGGLFTLLRSKENY